MSNIHLIQKLTNNLIKALKKGQWVLPTNRSTIVKYYFYFSNIVLSRIYKLYVVNVNER